MFDFQALVVAKALALDAVIHSAERAPFCLRGFVRALECIFVFVSEDVAYYAYNLGKVCLPMLQLLMIIQCLHASTMQYLSMMKS